jgi:protoporphyrin/coproporphyrin ferrochelatase
LFLHRWGHANAPNAFGLGEKIATLPGILLLAHGGPSSLDDVEPFLQQVRGGRPCSRELVDDVCERYRHIGGASPLPQITRRVAGGLEDACGLPVYVGMLHWHPFLEKTIPQMVDEGVSGALVMCLTPHFSACSVGQYRSRTRAAAAQARLAVDFVDCWHTSPPYIRGLADSVLAARKELAGAPAGPIHVIFSAHSLPKALLPPSDPYESQLRETTGLVAERLGLAPEHWTLAFQSVSGPGRDWLGPSVEEVLSGLAERGSTQAVLCPFGFVVDHVEILYDLDVVMKQRATEMGIEVSRAASLNDGPALIDSLALLVDQWKE